MLIGHSSGRTEIRVTLKISASLERKRSAFSQSRFSEEQSPHLHLLLELLKSKDSKNKQLTYTAIKSERA